MRRMMVLGLLAALLLAGCCNDPLTGCYTVSGIKIEPTPPPTPAPIADPAQVVSLYFASFNDTLSGVPAEQRFAQMYSLLAAGEACGQQRFVAMQQAIRANAGIYNTVEVKPEVLMTGDGQQAGVVAEVSTVFARGRQTFTLIKQDGWRITTISDEVNGADYSWPPRLDAAWYGAVACGEK